MVNDEWEKASKYARGVDTGAIASHKPISQRIANKYIQHCGYSYVLVMQSTCSDDLLYNLIMLQCRFSVPPQMTNSQTVRGMVRHDLILRHHTLAHG